MDKILGLKEKANELKTHSAKVRELIDTVIDSKSFVEMGAFAYSQNETFTDVKYDGEGIVTGYATIDGIPCYLYACNSEVLQGGFGIAQANKINNILAMAEKNATPVVSILDTAGARLGEGVTVLEGYSKVMKKVTELKGVVPQITVVNGKCFGGMTYLTAMTDLTVMVKDSLLSTVGPMALQAKEGTTASYDSLVGTAVHEANGVNALTVKKDELGATLSKLLDLMVCGDELVDVSPAGKSALNGELKAGEQVEAIVDPESAVELYKGYTENCKTYLAKVGGMSVGILSMTGAICTKMSRKATKFINMLNDLDIPMVTLVNSCGIDNRASMIKHTLIKDVADMAMAMVNSYNTKISVVTGDAVGIAYSTLCSKEMGIDYSIAWANAYISTLEAKTGAEIAYADDIEKATNKDKARTDAIEAYTANEANVLVAGKAGYIDNVIEPALTRPYIIQALSMLA